MFLTKNRLKKIKKVEDYDMLHYLKYSHLEPVKEDDVSPEARELRDQATQYPDIRNNFTQTKPIQISDKETDTYDDLNKMDRNARYILTGYDKSFKNDKQTQVNSYLIREYEPKNTSSKDDDDDDGAVDRNIKRGFRLAEFALEASLATASTTAQIAQSLWNATSPPEYDINNLQDEVEEEVEAPTSSEDVPHIARDRSRSRDSSSDLGDRLLQRGASRSNTNTPSSTPASSAKTTPRKKNILMKVI